MIAVDLHFLSRKDNDFVNCPDSIERHYLIIVKTCFPVLDIPNTWEILKQVKQPFFSSCVHELTMGNLQIHIYQQIVCLHFTIRYAICQRLISIFMEIRFHSLGNLPNIFLFGTHEVKTQLLKQLSSVNSKTYRDERQTKGTQTKNIYILTWSDFRL